MAVTKLSNSGIKTGGVLKYDSMLAGNPPYNPLTFDYESIATITASGGETSLVFSSIPQTYKHLQIRGLARYQGNAFNFTIGLRLRFNSDTGVNYWRHYWTANGSTTSSVGYNSDFAYLASSAPGGSVIANTFGASITDIADYSSTTKNKVIRYIAGTNANTTNTSFETAIGTSLWASTAAITNIQINFTDASGSAAAGTTFALYGIKG